MKNAEERMDVLAAYREVGTYRGAAEMCGTTHRTVRRVVERHNAGGAAPERKERGHNYDDVRTVVAEQVERTKVMALAEIPQGCSSKFPTLVGLSG